MGNDTYTSVPLDDDGPYVLGAAERRQRSPRLEKTMKWACLSLLTIVVFLLGFTAGDRYGQTVKAAVVSVGEKEAVVEGGESGNSGTLLPPQAFVPDCELSLGYLSPEESIWLGWESSRADEVAGSPHEGGQV